MRLFIRMKFIKANSKLVPEKTNYTRHIPNASQEILVINVS